MNKLINELKNFSLLILSKSKCLKKSKKILKETFKEVITTNNYDEKLLDKYEIIIIDKKNKNFKKILQYLQNKPNKIKILATKKLNDKVFNLIEKYKFDDFIVKPCSSGSIITTIRNIIEYKCNLNLLQQYKDIVDDSLIVSKTDLKGNITYVNDAFVKISGFKRDELLGKPHNIVRHPDVKKKVFKELWETILNKQTWRGLIKNRKKNGESYYVESIIKPIFDHEGNIKEFIALRHDITNFINAEQIINDKLQLIDQALLILVKIDNFSNIKLIYDEDTVTKIKKRVTKRVKNLLKKHFPQLEEYQIQDGIFGFLIETFDPQTLETIIQDTLKKVLNKPLIINEFEYYPLIKISYAYGNKHLYENAITGFEELKNSEERIIFANGLCKRKKEETLKNIKILRTIKHALHNNKIISLFQPIIDNKTGKPIKYESLIRIIDEEGKMLTPYHFLDIAKQAGLYSSLTIKVLENTFKVYKLKNIPISINLSPSDILIESIRNRIYAILEELKPQKGMITFELLEDEIIKFEHTMHEFIQKVTSLNAEIAIDDFGSGYSNFTRIIEANANIIKIDGILIKNIDQDTIKQDILEAIVNFAKKENKKTVAEFVENERIYETIKRIGVDYSQGYYFSKPIECNTIEASN